MVRRYSAEGGDTGSGGGGGGACRAGPQALVPLPLSISASDLATQNAGGAAAAVAACTPVAEERGARWPSKSTGAPDGDGDRMTDGDGR